MTVLVAAASRHGATEEIAESFATDDLVRVVGARDTARSAAGWSNPRSSGGSSACS
jgi:menaquinone-dependent protoporphyrinogen IX oxidase